MRRRYAELYRAAHRAVEACKVKPGESVVIYTDTGKNPATAEAFQAAAVASGADSVLINVLSRPMFAAPPKAAVKAMVGTDMVFDLASDSWLFSDACGDVLRSGARMLQVLVSDDGIIKRPPDVKVMRRVRAATAILKDCREFRVTSDLGTDCAFRRGDRPVFPQAGYVDEPGDWDSLGLGMINFSPPETEADGVVVFNGPMDCSPDHLFVLEQPFRVEFKRGRIVKVDTPHAQARLFDAWLKKWNDPNIYVVAHVGFGLDHRAKVCDNDIGAWESFCGGVIVALGANISPIGGGQNRCDGHMDAELHGANLDIDGRRILEKGKFIVPELM